MAQPIYKVFLLKFKEPWYALSKAEQDGLLQKLNASMEQVGGKTQILCDSSWSSEVWQGFGVEMYPSLESVQQYTKALNDLNWFRYIESFSALGTPFPTP